MHNNRFKKKKYDLFFKYTFIVLTTKINLNYKLFFLFQQEKLKYKESRSN